MAKVRPIPEGFHAVTAALIIRDAPAAIEFYKKAFGATELKRKLGPNGKIIHGEIKIGDSIVFLCDEIPEMDCKSVQSFGGSPVSMYLYVPDVDATFKSAAAAGAKVRMEPMDSFWGDRHACVVDPFGFTWSMATHVEDLTPEEMDRRAAAFFSGKKPGC